MALAHVFMQIMLLRACGVVLLVCVGNLTLKASFETHAVSQRVILTGIYGCNLLLILMVVATPSPFNYTWYFVGLYIVFFFQFGFFYLKSKVCADSGRDHVFIDSRSSGDEQDSLARRFLHGLVLSLQRNGDRPWRVRARGTGLARALCSRARAGRAQPRVDDRERCSSSRRTWICWQPKKDQDTKTNALLALKEQQMLAAETASKDKSNFLAGGNARFAPTHARAQPLPSGSRRGHPPRNVTEAARLIDESGRSSVILARFLNAVLDLSRLESGRDHAAISRFRCEDRGPRSRRTIAPARGTPGVELRLRMPHTPVYVRSDAHWLGRAIVNLVSNGIRYADASKKANPVVIVGVVRSATRTRVDVVDNGIGIAAEHWDAIFQPFFQVGNKEQDNDKGLGLGLSIVNAVVSMLEEHRIELKSAEGLGSRFSLEMPICGSPLVSTQRHRAHATRPIISGCRSKDSTCCWWKTTSRAGVD